MVFWLSELSEKEPQSNAVVLYEMPILKAVRQTLGEIAALLLILFFILSFILLAIFNLLLFRNMSVSGLLASAVWLILLLLCGWGLHTYNAGLQHSFLCLMGVFSRNHFAAVCRQPEGWNALCFGYKLFGLRFYVLNIKCEGIQTVDWSMGQLSGRLGRDANDWQVVVWYDKRKATKGSWDCIDKHDLGLYIVGPEQTKIKTEELGNRLVGFLRDAGVPAAQKILPNPKVLEEMSAETADKHKVYLEGYGEFYYRSTKGRLKSGTKVRGVENRGLSLYVEPIESEGITEDKI